jgi:hypothetical protein
VSLARFRELAGELRRAVEGDDWTAVEAALAERRRLLGSLAAEREAEPAGIDLLLREIAGLDRETEALLHAKGGELRSEIAALETGRLGLSAYGTDRRAPGKWIDERG